MTKSWKIELFLLPWIDGLAVAAAYFLAFWLRLESGWVHHDPKIDVYSYQLVFFLSLPIIWMLFYGCHLYDLQEIFYGTAEYVQVIKGVTFGVLGVIVVSFFVHSPPFSRTWLLLFWVFGIIFVGLARFAIRRIIRPLFRSGRRSERTLIVGASEEARAIAQTLKETGRLDIVGFLDDFSPVGEKVCGEITIKGSPQDYERIAREEDVHLLILVPGAVSWETYWEISFEATRRNGLDVLVAPRLSGLFSGNLRVSYIGYVPMLRFQPGYTGGMDKAVKTFLDLSLGLLLFVVSLPAMLVISLWLLLCKGRPLFERHQVLGLHGRPFCSYKFRTGFPSANHRCFHSASSSPGAGKFSLERLLLISGLDKLPQLINVLRGQISLVGPRTVSISEAQSYDIWAQNMVAVKPGMTGPWALSEARDLQQEIALTLSYIHTWTPWKDLQILCLTLFYLLQKRLMVPTPDGQGA